MAAHIWSDPVYVLIALLIGAGLAVVLIRGAGVSPKRLAGRIDALDLRFDALLSQTRLLEARYDEAIARLAEVSGAADDTRMELGEILGGLAGAQRLIEQRAVARDTAREARQERRLCGLEDDLARALDGLTRAGVADREAFGAGQDRVLAALEQTRQQVASLGARLAQVEEATARRPGLQSDPPDPLSIGSPERLAGIEFRLDALEDAVATLGPTSAIAEPPGAGGAAGTTPERHVDPGLTMPLRVISIIER